MSSNKTIYSACTATLSISITKS